MQAFVTVVDNFLSDSVGHIFMCTFSSFSYFLIKIRSLIYESTLRYQKTWLTSVAELRLSINRCVVQTGPGIVENMT